MEKNENSFDFSDLDWQMNELQKRNIKTVVVIGMKVPRWPECHEPSWTENQKLNIKNQNLLEYIKQIVNRYKDSKAIWAWQVENEPFFPFGECPKFDEGLLKKEIESVKSIDSRPVVISDTGELSLWFGPARLGDVVGITMYRKAWFDNLKSYISYPFPPIFYGRKADLVKWIFGKKVICVELQAEPWGPKPLYANLALNEQEKTMNLEKFKENIEFAKNTGLDSFYLWGLEWAYWMKEKQAKPEIWEEMKGLFEK